MKHTHVRGVTRKHLLDPVLTVKGLFQSVICEIFMETYSKQVIGDVNRFEIVMLSAWLELV